MKRALRTIGTTRLYHFVDGVHIAGAPSDLWGNVSDLWGDVTPKPTERNRRKRNRRRVRG